MGFRLRFAMTVLAAAAVVACSSPTQPSTPAASVIDDFVAASPFPAKQAVQVFPFAGDNAVSLFRLDFGPPHDCPSGCFFSFAYGVLNRGKIGWFKVEDYDADIRNNGDYVFDDEDANLFTQGFMDALTGADSRGLFRSHFLEAAAASPLVGPSALLFMISQVDIDDALVTRALIANPVVRADCDLIRALAARPAHQLIRTELDALRATCPAA